MDKYSVRPLRNEKKFTVTVPGSKSITNRALLLAAMCRGKCTLTGVLFSDDSRAFLSCLNTLGYRLDINEEAKTVTIEGGAGTIPGILPAIPDGNVSREDTERRIPSLNVGSAGTAARFLTVFLAFAGGEYHLDSSKQMRKRPMEPLISDLRRAGVEITCTEEDGHFPFIIRSSGVNVSEMSSNTDVSSQFASAIIMVAPLLKNGLTLKLEGSRTTGSYIGITLNMMSQFGLGYTRTGDTIEILPGYGQSHTQTDLICANDVQDQNTVNTSVWQINNPSVYDIEPDMSAACYFYAMAPICGRIMQVRGVHPYSMQGDFQFVKAMEKLGCSIEDDPDGIILNPPVNGTYPGIDINMKDYSDQTMTMAVVAAFASSPSAIHDIGHIRFQESDRLDAIINELNRLGCECTAIDGNTGIHIKPQSMHGAEIETYDDHRIAMAFALAGLRVQGVTILNPMCCRKTFEDYFDVLDSITVQ